MLTVILKRNAEPNVIQLTEENIMRELSSLSHSEMLLTDTWEEGLKKVRTPYVCLVEADCTLSGGYLSSNLGLIRKDNHNSTKGTGGYLKRAMLASCLGYRSFANRIYSYCLPEMVDLENAKKANLFIEPSRHKPSTRPFQVQIGFVPGAIIRYSAIKDVIDDFKWDDASLVKLSADLSFYFWDTNRRIQTNPNTTYVSNEEGLEQPLAYVYDHPKATSIFEREDI